MSAWGMGVFDNDDALDFLEELRAAPFGRQTLVRGALRLIADSDEYVEAPDVTVAVAAAALVAAGGHPGLLDGELYKPDWWAVDAVMLSATDRRLALRALQRTLDPFDNEWVERWQDEGVLGAVEGRVQPLIDALSATERSSHARPRRWVPDQRS